MRKLLYQGSVKNLYQRDDKIEFEFTDQYSIFDWGVMPDQIEAKGENLAKTTALFFEKLHNANSFGSLIKPHFLTQESYDSLMQTESFARMKSNGAKTHFLGYQAPSSILVNQVAILKPHFEKDTYNYQAYENRPEDTLIPLEVVWRLGAPEGSSILKREKNLQPNQNFSSIRVELFTKLEPQDRHLDTKRAQEMAGLSDIELEDMINQTKIIAILLENTFVKIGFKLWDGKLEFAFGKSINGQREIILVDSIGPDELRLTHKGFSFSKEYLRNIYKNSTWHKELCAHKINFGDNFKVETKSKPTPLTTEQKNTAAAIYNNIYDSLKSEELTLNAEIQRQITVAPHKVVIFGKGGREHALASHLAKESQIEKVFVIPGNPGMASPKILTYDVDPTDYLSFCQNNHVQYALIGPEDLLEAGLADELEAGGIPCASPNQMAAKLESSKAFAKNLMAKYEIPTASFCNFTNSELAKKYVNESEQNSFVVKLSGLAAGKGVIICHQKDEALKAIEGLAPNNEELVIEEFMEGKEVSFFALCLGENYKILGTACDYKRLKDNNVGPNTGGMGCYSPASWLSHDELAEIKNKILEPSLHALAQEKIFFKGTIFIGLMMTNEGPKVLEYNVRFGDPETQTILPRLSTNLHQVLRSMAINSPERFNSSKIKYGDQVSVHVVKAAKGYPGTQGVVIERGQVIHNELESTEQTQLFFAGIKEQDQKFYTNGGRVLGVTNLGPDIENARKEAYKKINLIHFGGEQYRKDIGL